MRKANELTRKELEDIVYRLQQSLYLEYADDEDENESEDGHLCWEVPIDVIVYERAIDVVFGLMNMMDDYGLQPAEREPFTPL